MELVNEIKVGDFMNVKKDNCNKKKGIGFYIMCSVFILSFILLLYLCETTIVGWIGMFLVVSMLLLCRRTRFWKGILIPVFWVASISMVGLAFSVSNKISIMGAFSNKVIVRIAMRMPNDFADKLYNKKEVLLINKKNANTD